MSGQMLKVPPTKNTLLRLKRQVNFLENGHDLLERKRELLTRLVYERINQYRRLCEDTDTRLERAYRCLSVTQMRMGGRSIHQAAMGAERTLDLHILPRRSLGIEYPAITAERRPIRPLGFLGVDISFDSTREGMTDLTVALARLSEVELALHRLMEEQRKAQKLVNALKHNIIPRYERTIRYIEASLEEEERNSLFQNKLLRERAEKSARNLQSE
ncbi:MAG: V-type ATP synthase subunit D [Pseudomonadota bacterium]